jgi:hypothetical protein
MWSLGAARNVGENPGRQAVDAFEVVLLVILRDCVVAAFLPVTAECIALLDTVARHGVTA